MKAPAFADRAIRMPATAGPMARAALTIDELSAIALTRSSLPTISTTKDWRAGTSKALTMPRPAASAKTCQTCTRPENTSAASVSGRIIDAVCVTTRMRWRL